MDDLDRHVSPSTLTYRFQAPVALENGRRLQDVRIAYRTWGRLARTRDNAIVVCHALTGSADVDQWWAGMLGPDLALDPERDFIVCTNILGSCYGTTGPLSTEPETGKPYRASFPQITVRDMVRIQSTVLEHLGIEKVRAVIGGSLGGMQALEWGLMFPDMVDAIIPIAVSSRHSAWCIGLSEAQRQAIFADADWKDGYYDADTPPSAGLRAARMMAMCSYRSRLDFHERFSRSFQPGVRGLFQVESYLRYQGAKLDGRFDANSYVLLSRAMDSHDVCRGRGKLGKVLGAMKMPALVVSIDSDILYPPIEQHELSDLMPNAELCVLHSPHGHDSFLIDVNELSSLVRDFLEEN